MFCSYCVVLPQKKGLFDVNGAFPSGIDTSFKESDPVGKEEEIVVAPDVEYRSIVDIAGHVRLNIVDTCVSELFLQ